MPTVVIAVGDLGAAVDLVLVGVELVKLGWNVQWMADQDGEARTKVLDERGISYEMREPTPLDTPDRIVVGTSATKARLGNTWTKFGRDNKIPTIVFCDLWGTENSPSMDGFDPDVQLVIDPEHAVNAKLRRPDVPKIMVGKPSFAAISLEKLAEERLALRDSFGLARDQVFIVFWTGGENAERTMEQLRAMAALMPDVGRHASLAVRVHPKHKKNAPQVQSEGGIYLRLAGWNLVDADKVKNADALSAAADIVLADWGGTEGFKSLVIGRPTGVFVNFPDDQAKLTAKHKDGLPPHIRSHGAIALNSASDLRSFVLQASRDVRGGHQKVWEERSSAYRRLIDPAAASKAATAVIDAKLVAGAGCG